MPVWSHEQKYIYFRLRRFVTESRWEMKRLPIAGTRDLIQEVLRSMEPGSKDNTALLLGELRQRLQTNPIFALPSLQRDREVLLSILGKENAEKQPETKVLISCFFKQLNGTDLVGLHVDALRALLAQKPFPYDDVDTVLASLCLELIHSGYSLAFFKRSLGAAPDWTQTLPDYLLQIASQLKQYHHRQFSLFFKMTLPSEFVDLSAIQDVEPLTEVPVDLLGCQNLEELRSFLGTGASTVRVRRQAADVLRAAEEARTELGRLTDVFRLNRTTYDPSISDQVLVFDPLTCTCQTESVSDLPYHPIRVLVTDFFPLSTSPDLDPSSRDAVFRSLYWLRAAESASSPESKLVAMWIATEFLFPQRKSSLDPVLEFVPSFLQLYYVPMTMGYLSQSLDFLAKKNRSNELVLKPPRTVGTGYNHDLAHHLLTQTRPILAAIEKDDILVRDVTTFCVMMNTRGALYQMLQDYEQQVTNDIRRIYRYRNLLVHEAALSSQTVFRCIDRLNIFTSTVLNGILYDLRRSPRLTLQEVLTSRKEACSQYKQKLEKRAAKDIMAEAVQPPLLFSP